MYVVILSFQTSAGVRSRRRFEADPALACGEARSPPGVRGEGAPWVTHSER